MSKVRLVPIQQAPKVLKKEYGIDASLPAIRRWWQRRIYPELFVKIGRKVYVLPDKIPLIIQKEQERQLSKKPRNVYPKTQDISTDEVKARVERVISSVLNNR